MCIQNVLYIHIHTHTYIYIYIYSCENYIRLIKKINPTLIHYMVHICTDYLYTGYQYYNIIVNYLFRSCISLAKS